ncbi:hypothetical protein PC128_g14897 [Phytophthora cactorum]|nr:hypothetical protein PC128_g14897 [Phytophthora cactorum]
MNQLLTVRARFFAVPRSLASRRGAPSTTYHYLVPSLQPVTGVSGHSRSANRDLWNASTLCRDLAVELGRNNTLNIAASWIIVCLVTSLFITGV